MPVSTSAVDVSRETAEAVFGPSLPTAEAYAELLRSDGVLRGLIGPRETDRLWSRHLINSAAWAGILPVGAKVADIGSGAGLPGIPLALVRPDLTVVLVEPLLRRVAFLRDAVAHLGIPNVDVVRSRAEDLPRGWVADVVTARAVAPLPTLVGWAMPLVAPGGELIAMKGTRAGDELTAAAPSLRRLGAQSWSVLEVPGGELDDPIRLVRIRKKRSARR